MEAAFVNTVGPGDVVVVGVNGLFGVRMCDVASRCGAEVVRVDAPWGQPLDVDAVLSAHPSPRLIAAVHAETSTGIRNDVAAIAAGKGDALFLADCVTSLAGIELAIDDWAIDLAHSGTQKCIGVAPGLSPFTINERAWNGGSNVRSPGTSIWACWRLCRCGHRWRWSHLSPHRADGDGRVAARRSGRVPEEGLDSVIARPDIVTLILGALGEILDRR